MTRVRRAPDFAPGLWTAGFLDLLAMFVPFRFPFTCVFPQLSLLEVPPGVGLDHLLHHLLGANQA
jgi:hypothetical protein